MNVQIEVCQRLGDWYLDHDGKEQPKYHAQIKGKPGVWACGRSPASAIGDLILCNTELFNIQLTFLEGKQPR